MRRVKQWRWHLDEVFVKIRGETHYLRRAVDHEGSVIEAYVTKKRDKGPALNFLRKAMKRYGNPEVVVTDKCPSYHAAMRVIGNEGRKETGRHLNNRAENSHLPLRRSERSPVFVACEVFKNSCLPTPLYTIISISKGTFTFAQISKPGATPHFVNGEIFLLPDTRSRVNIGDWFAFV